MSTGIHPLDNPVWHGLAGGHAGFAQGGPLALRYAAGVTPLAAVRDSGDPCYRALADLFEPREVTGIFVQGERLPAGWRIVAEPPLIQMVCDRLRETVTAPMEPLGTADVPALLELAALTNPGPFGQRSAELGRYIGIRQDGLLVAMAGERLRFSGFTEVSGVCTRPGYRGRGYARALIHDLSQAILARGEFPFLHVRVDNVSAVRAYEALGFRTRRFLNFKLIRLESRGLSG